MSSSKARLYSGQRLHRPSVEAAQLNDEVARQGSEERCLKAWQEWWYPIEPPSFRDVETERAMLTFTAWHACWKYLEQRAEEFIRS